MRFLFFSVIAMCWLLLIAINPTQAGPLQRPPSCFATSDNGLTVFDGTSAEVVQQAIDVAAVGATVKISGICAGMPLQAAPALYHGPALIASLVITHPLRIEGGYNVLDWSQQDQFATTVIDAQAGGRLLTVVGASLVEVDSLVLRAGNAAGLGGTPISEYDVGGGVFVQKSKLILTNSTLAAHYGPTAGGAIYATKTPIAIEDSLLMNNTSATGGAIWTDSQITLRQSVVKDNAAGSHGGGIYVSGQQLTEPGVYIYDSVLEYNQAYDSGGAVYIEAGMLQTNRTIVQYNQALHGSGGGFAVHGALELMRSTVQTNTASLVGGGLFIGSFSSNVVVHSSAFLGNNAAAGGGIFSSSENFRLRSAVIHSNTGGGLYLMRTQLTHACMADIADVEIVANVGGGLLVNHCSVQLYDIALKHNHSSPQVQNRQPSPGAVAAGTVPFGGMLVYNASISIQHITILNNTSHADGAGLAIYNDSELEHVVDVDTVTISGNQAVGRGGGLSLMTPRKTSVNLTSVTIGYNSASSGGGLALVSSLPASARSNDTVPTLSVFNTIIAQSQGADCYLDGGVFIDAGFSMISDPSCGSLVWRDARLQPLVETGERVVFHELQPNSPAIDTGICVASIDQRGYPRPSMHSRFCDIGAIESAAFSPIITRVYLPFVRR